jgi:hypothetical protein
MSQALQGAGLIAPWRDYSSDPPDVGSMQTAAVIWSELGQSQESMKDEMFFVGIAIDGKWEPLQQGHHLGP